MDELNAGMKLEEMKRRYNHIRINDDEWEAIELAVAALREQQELKEENAELRDRIKWCVNQLMLIQNTLKPIYTDDFVFKIPKNLQGGSGGNRAIDEFLVKPEDVRGNK